MILGQIIFGMIVLSIGIPQSLALVGSPIDSTSVVPIPINAVDPNIATPITLRVLHVTQGPLGSVGICPRPRYSTSGWVGQSPISSTLIRSKTFPVLVGYDGSGVIRSTDSGYLIFTCAETYWPSDPYYKRLQAHLLAPNAVTTCQNPNYDREMCTIAPKEELSGFLPVHFVVIWPTQKMVRNDPKSGYNRVGVMSVPYLNTVLSVGPTLHGASNIGPFIDGFGFPTNPPAWEQEFSLPLAVDSVLNVSLMFDIVYQQSDGGGNGYIVGYTNNPGPPPGNVRLTCPPSFIAGGGWFKLTITADMLGKTCEISCNESTISINPGYPKQNGSYFDKATQRDINGTYDLLLGGSMNIQCYE